MGLLDSPVKYSRVWAKTSSCSAEHHLYSTLSLAVVTNPVSNLYVRGNLKFSQDNEDSIPTLAEKKIKEYLQWSKVAKPEFFCLIYLVVPLAVLCWRLLLVELLLPLWASKISSSCIPTSVDETWPASPHPAGLTHGNLSCNTWVYLCLKTCNMELCEWHRRYLLNNGGLC